MRELWYKFRCWIGWHDWTLWYSKSEEFIEDKEHKVWREEHVSCKRCEQQVIRVWKEDPNPWKVEDGRESDKPVTETR